MTAAKIMDVIAISPNCDGQAADAISAYTQEKLEDALRLFNIPKSERADVWVRLPRHNWPKSWSNSEDPVVLLERHLKGHRLDGLWLERQLQEALLELGWEKLPNWESLIEKKGCFCQYMWMTSKWLERSRIWLPCGTNRWKTLILRNQHHFLTMKTWDVLNVNANQMKRLLNNIRRCLNHVFLLEQLKSYQGGKSLTQKEWPGPTIGTCSKNELSDTVNWQTRKWSSLKEFQAHALMIIVFSRRNSKPLENCQKFAHKLSWMLVLGTNWKTWHSVIG